MVKVHEDDFRLLQGEDHLADYQFNTRTAHHHFCKVCGIYTFHRKRTAPDHFGVNVFCLDDVDLEGIPVRNTNGAKLGTVDEHAGHL